MLRFTQGSTDDEIVVTLNEKRTLSSGYYLFLFEHIATRQTTTKIFNFSEDESDYPDRFNLFSINTSVVFLDKPLGEWNYTVYEQASSSNVNPSGLTEVERGFVKLVPSTEFEFESYNGATSYKQYEG